MTLVCLLLLSAPPRGDAAPVSMTYESWALGKSYVVCIEQEEIRRTPQWKQNAENPPLSAGRALELAEKVRSTIVQDTKDYKWQLDTATLVPAGDERWFWKIEYEAKRTPKGSPWPAQQTGGAMHHLILGVLMDGRVIKPAPKAAPKLTPELERIYRESMTLPAPANRR